MKTLSYLIIEYLKKKTSENIVVDLGRLSNILHHHIG